MKTFSCFIILFLLGIHSNAQVFLKDTTLINHESFFARVEADLSPGKKDLPTVIFITVKADNKVKTLSQQSFDSLSPSEKMIFNKVKIVIFPKSDSLTAADFQALSKDIMAEILNDKKSSLAKISKEHLIISGINEGAVLAVYVAALFPEAISKTGIFIDNYPEFFKMKEELSAFVSKMKGKVFISTQSEVKENFATAFADSLALNAGVMIVKIDDLKENNAKDLFTEFYKWSVADGNNYIIDIKQ